MGASCLMASRRLSSAAPTPTSVLGANCLIDLRRGAGLGYSSGSLVNAWADQSGSGNNFSALFTEPTDTAGPDGLDFNGSTAAIGAPDVPAFDTTTAMVVGIKLTPDVITGNKVPVARGPSTGGTWSMQTNGAAMRAHIGVPGVSFGEGGTLAAGVSTYFLWYFNGGGGSSATRLIMRQNGSGLTLSFPTGAIPATMAAGSDGIELGRYSNAVQHFDGKIAAFFVGNVVPSAGQITDLETYLAGA